MHNEVGNFVEETIEFFYVPDAITAEILKGLPVKSVLRCMCVQKSWYRLIKSPMFINLHLNYQVATAHNPKYLMFQFHDLECFLCNDDKQCGKVVKLDQIPPALEYLNFYDLWKTSSSSSLICLSTIFEYQKERNYIGDTYLWNPFIRSCKTLPHPVNHVSGPEYSVYCGGLAFGYVPNINDHLVVKIISYHDANKIRSFMISVYSLSSDSWRYITIQDKMCVVDIGWTSATVNGASFWAAHTFKKVNILLCFDTRNDILQTILLPKEARSYHSLYHFGKSVTLVSQDIWGSCFKIWVLKEGPMNEFLWEKMFRVSLEETIFKQVLCVRNNGELLLSKLNECDFVSCNVETNEITDFADAWNEWPDSWDWWPSIGSALDSNVFFDDPVPFTVYPLVGSLVFLDTK